MNNFWNNHGFWFIFFMMLFPRLTMFFATVSGGFWWWLGWLFVPRLTVAIISTTYYWNSNQLLVIFTWIWAISGEILEKK